jgi:hypothetical protein
MAQSLVDATQAKSLDGKEAATSRWCGPLTQKQSTCLSRIFELRAADDRRHA